MKVDPDYLHQQKRHKSKIKASYLTSDEIDFTNQNIRYCRARVLIKWTQSFNWESSEGEFKAKLKDIIVNRKLSTIPDRNKLNTKLDYVIEAFIKYETLAEGESDKRYEESDNTYVEVSYNILDKNLGELITSSIKAVLLDQE